MTQKPSELMTIEKTDDVTTITIDKKAGLFIVDEAGNFLLTHQAEDYITKIREAADYIKQLEEALKTYLGNKMSEEDVLKIVGEDYSIVRQYFGAKYEITDKDIAEAGGFAKIKTTLTPDTKAIEDYMKDNDGQCPEGVKPRQRVLKPAIRTRRG